MSGSHLPLPHCPSHTAGAKAAGKLILHLTPFAGLCVALWATSEHLGRRISEPVDKLREEMGSQGDKLRKEMGSQGDKLREELGSRMEANRVEARQDLREARAEAREGLREVRASLEKLSAQIASNGSRH